MAFNTMYQVFKKPHNQPQEELKTIVPFQFQRWLGMSPITVHAANIFNKYVDIPPELQFEMVNLSYGGKGVYIKNIPKWNIDKKTLMVAKYYKISLDKAKEYRELESEENLEKIYNCFKHYKPSDLTSGMMSSDIKRIK